MTKKSTLTIALVLMLLMAACQPALEPAVKTVVETVEVEKVVVVEKEPGPFDLTVVIPEEPPHLNPHDWGMFNHYPLLNAYEPLVNRDGQTGEIIPALATSWERTGELTWEFHIREGVEFHNGEPLTAEVVAWNLETVTESDKFASGLAGTLEVEVKGDLVVEVTTAKPEPVLPRFFYFMLMAEPGAVDPDHQDMVGTGAFVLDEWEHGHSITMHANEDYWGGRPEVDSLTFVWRSDSAVRAAMVAVGEAQIAALLTLDDVGPVRTLGVDIPETSFLYFDPTAPLDDIRVRQAACMSIDREGLAKMLYGGYASPASQIITPDVAGYSDDIPLMPFDLEAARKLVEEAGSDGVPVDEEITIYGRRGIYPKATEVMEATQAWLTEAGLNVKLQMLEVGAWREVNLGIPVPPDRVGIIQSSHGNEIGDASYTLRAYMGPYYGVEGWYGLDDEHGTGRRPVVDPELVGLIDEALVLDEGEGRAETMAAAMERHHETTLWACPMLHLQDLWGVSESVKWQPRFNRTLLAKEIGR